MTAWSLAAAVALTGAALAGTVAASPPAGAQTILGGDTTTTSSLVPLPSVTTTTAPAPPTTSAPAPAQPGAQPTTSTTTRPKSPVTGVPSVPVGGPPTTAAKPGTPPTTQPDPSPILTQVDTDLAQLTAISDYQPAQALVAAAQGQVTQASAALLSARQGVAQAQTTVAGAKSAKSTADGKLRQLAIAAYIGVGFTSPGLNEPAQGNGDQGQGTVSTPDGLTGISAIDAREMLLIVGQHARQQDDDAAQVVSQAAKSAKSATAAYRKAQATVAAAEAHLLAAQQTLKLIANAATTPGAAAATPLAALLDAATKGTTPVTAPTTTTTTTTTVPAGAAVPAANHVPLPSSPAILGPPTLNAAQLSAWWSTLNRHPNITVPMNQLIASYAKWGAKLGVAYDVAFAQSIVETGYFSFPAYGQLTDKDNNFAGIGACDSCAHGWSFPDADTGALAQMELLYEYATNSVLPTGVKNVIGGTGVGGCCVTWTQLAGKWATSTVYGISIMTVYQQMLQWLIPQQELSVGLITPKSPAPPGPALAPLPGGKATATTTTAPGISAANLKH